MGMFDWVEREPAKCPICGKEISKFQSKCGFKRLFHLTPEQLIEDSIRMWGECWADEIEYYGFCNNDCGAYFYTYDRDTKKWTEEFLTHKDLYGSEES